ncbi:MAG: hypothetical protein ACHQCF_06995, partial [Solirubrobacterales bacterium]
TLAWEARWGRRVGLATLFAVALLIASVVAIASISSGGEAESLRSVHEHSSSVTLSGILQAAAFALLIAPLVYLFRAAAARAPRMRKQFLGLVIAAPIFLCIASLLNVIAAHDAANEFVAGNSRTNLSVKEATRECTNERKENSSSFKEEFGGPSGGGTRLCAQTKRANDEAKNAITDASARPFAEGLRIGGGLGLAFALAYGCLYAMRVGLLSRFWGSLGIALGVAAALGLFQFALIWFIYFGLLACGWLPGGRPPAWAAGEAVPWPTPGEKTAEALGSPADELGSAAEEPPQLPEGGGEPSERPRKRKRRGPSEPGDRSQPGEPGDE